MNEILKAMAALDWTAIGALGAFFAAVWYCCLTYKLWKTSQAQSRAAAFIEIRTVLQEQRIREARGTVMGETEPYAKWKTDAKKREAAEFVCHTYCYLGEMIHYGHVEPAVALQWENSIQECWKRLEPMVKEMRLERGEYHWMGFDYLTALLEYQRGKLRPKSLLVAWQRLQPHSYAESVPALNNATAAQTTSGTSGENSAMQE
jgi:hypothetical protein